SGVEGDGHDVHAGLGGNAADGLGHLGVVADDQEGGLLLDGAQLALVAVGQDDDVPLFHGALQHFGGGGADVDVAGGAHPVLAAHHHLAAQRLEDVLIGGVGLGQHGGVEHVHVGGGDVLDGDDAQQVALRADHRQRVDVPVPHDLPGAAQADGAVDACHLADIHVAVLVVEVGAM